MIALATSTCSSFNTLFLIHALYYLLKLGPSGVTQFQSSNPIYMLHSQSPFPLYVAIVPFQHNL